jgi:hypothetical protein
MNKTASTKPRASARFCSLLRPVLKGCFRSDVEELRKNWRPQDMLPKMYKDREITKGPTTVDAAYAGLL